jgi:hypothetical protein
MKVCSKCGDEFRADVLMCTRCHIELSNPHELQSAVQASKMSPHEQLAGVPTVPLMEGTLDSCREIERALLSANIPVVLESRKAQGPQNLGSAQQTRYAIIIAESDIPNAAGVLQNQFAAMVAREGTGAFVTEAIDLSALEITCPACGHQGALDEGRCADCELFLGEGA